VPDDVLARVLDATRFAPTGGNRQPVRFVAVRDAAKRQRLQELYLPHWETYFASVTRGEVRVGALPKIIANATTCAAPRRGASATVARAKLADVHPTDAALGRSRSWAALRSIRRANLLPAARAKARYVATTLLCAVG
jgi:nitroreductase